MLSAILHRQAFVKWLGAPRAEPFGASGTWHRTARPKPIMQLVYLSISEHIQKVRDRIDDQPPAPPRRRGTLPYLHPWLHRFSSLVSITWIAWPTRMLRGYAFTSRVFWFSAPCFNNGTIGRYLWHESRAEQYMCALTYHLVPNDLIL